MSNLELRIEEEASLELTFGESTDMEFNAVDFVGVPFAPTVEVEDIEGGHRVSITSMGAEGKKTDEFDVMDGATGATGPQGPAGEDYVITQADYQAIATQVESDIQPTIDDAQSATQAANDAAALATRAAAATWNEGNVPYGTLTGDVLTADDAWSAPAKSVGVYGKSTQVQTTGKNLIPTIMPDNAIHAQMSSEVITSAGNAWVFAIPCERNTDYYFSSATNGAIGVIGLSTSLPEVGGAYTRLSGMANYRTYAIHTGENDYILIQVASTAQFDAIPSYDGMIEKGSTATAYEPWSGGAASPRPDWPQEIESVDGATLYFTGSNICGGEKLVENAPTDSYGEDDGGKYVEIGTGHSKWNAGEDVVFKPNTQYTFIIRAKRLASAHTWTQLYFAYDDGSSTNISFPGTAVGSTALFAVKSAENKTLHHVNAGNGFSGQSRIYYDQCGIFEGTLTADDFEPYVGQSVQVLDTPLRSLPDGTEDSLTLSYIGPSTEHEGWGVFGVELTQRVSTVTFDGTTREMNYVSTQNLSYAAGPIPADATSYPSTGLKPILCDHFANAVAEDSCYFASNTIVIRCGTLFAPTSRTEVNEWLQEHPTTFYYQLASEVTHDLGTVELPVNPAPDLTAWADGGSVQPTMSMVYEQDINIVIGELRSAIADMATS